MVQEQVDERGHELDRERRGLLRIGIAEVYNPSMVPTLNPGDQLVVRYGAAVRPGDVVVLRHPFRQDLLIVKRVVERREGGWWVTGGQPPGGERQPGVRHRARRVRRRPRLAAAAPAAAGRSALGDRAAVLAGVGGQARARR
ncbi:hypothetical protein GCM10020000_26460 [Streptomyces olivoverticillatus]